MPVRLNGLFKENAWNLFNLFSGMCDYFFQKINLRVLQNVSGYKFTFVPTICDDIHEESYL